MADEFPFATSEYERSIGKDKLLYAGDMAANRRLNQAERDYEQRVLDGMKPEQRAEKIAERRLNDRSAAYLDGPMATREDRLNYYGAEHKFQDKNRPPLTPEESDVFSKARRQVTNEDKRMENMSRAMKADQTRMDAAGKKKGGAIKAKPSAPKSLAASKRADGCAVRGKTKGRIV